MIKIGTLFSGIGAFEEALMKQGIDYEIAFAADNGEREIKSTAEEILEKTKGMSMEDKNDYIEKLYLRESKRPNYMQKQYLANFDVPHGHYYQDVRFLDGNDYKKLNLDLIVGGSPCQSFSIIGKRGGLEDTRGTLFYEYARIVKQSNPKAFIYENVVGMLNHDKGKTWETIYNIFKSLDYDVKLLVLNSKDYGIPQDRKRIFVIGTKQPNTMETPAKIALTTAVSDYLEERVPAIYYLGKKGFEFVTNPAYKSRAKVNKDIMMCQKANQQFNWNGDFRFEELNDRHTDEILARAYVGMYQGVRGVARQLTPRECFRLMGFDDAYQIVGKNNIAWRQAGNAIVVNVLEAIIKEMREKGLLIC